METAGHLHPLDTPVCRLSALLNSTPAQSFNHCISSSFPASDHHCKPHSQTGPLTNFCVATLAACLLLCILQLFHYLATRGFHILPGLDAPDLGTTLRYSPPSQPSQQSFHICLAKKCSASLRLSGESLQQWSLFCFFDSTLRRDMGNYIRNSVSPVQGCSAAEDGKVWACLHEGVPNSLTVGEKF